MKKTKFDKALDEKRLRLLKERDIISTELELAEKRDLNERFGHYNDDLSVGGMYQRKSVKRKRKVKRKSGCGCK